MFGFSRNIFRYNAINLLFRASRNVAKAAPRAMSRSLVTAAPKASHFLKPLAFGIIGGLAAAAGIYAYADVTPLELTQSIDHTLLSPSATLRDIQQVCEEAVKYHFWSVCIPPIFIKEAKHYLDYKEADVKICCVIAFPLGAVSPAIKLEEAKMAIKDGADELDMVINVAALKENDLKCLHDEITPIVIESHRHNVLVKVIIETCLLNRKEIRKVVRLCGDIGVDFVKTSTGFQKEGANATDVKIMYEEAQKYNMKVKASGGIRSLDNATEMLDAGACRLGTSSSIKIYTELTAAE